MALFDSIGWRQLQIIINWLLFPFIFSGYDDYILASVTSYRLELGSKETFVLLQLIKLKALQLMDEGVLKNVPELDRLSDAEYIPKIIQNSLKSAKDANHGLDYLTSASGRTVFKAKETLQQLLSEYLSGEKEFIELVYAFDNYYRAIVSSKK